MSALATRTPENVDQTSARNTMQRQEKEKRLGGKSSTTSLKSPSPNLQRFIHSPSPTPRKNQPTPTERTLSRLSQATKSGTSCPPTPEPINKLKTTAPSQAMAAKPVRMPKMIIPVSESRKLDRSKVKRTTNNTKAIPPTEKQLTAKRPLKAPSEAPAAKKVKTSLAPEKIATLANAKNPVKGTPITANLTPTSRRIPSRPTYPRPWQDNMKIPSAPSEKQAYIARRLKSILRRRTLVPQPPPTLSTSSQSSASRTGSIRKVRSLVQPNLPMVPKPPLHHVEVLVNVDPAKRFEAGEELGRGVNGPVLHLFYRPDVLARRRIQQASLSRTRHVASTASGTHPGLAFKVCHFYHNDLPLQNALLREIKLSSYGHQNLVCVEEVIVWGEDKVWVGMELMAGSVFGLLVHGGMGLSQEMCIYVANEVLCGLAFLHEQGYFHRDCKSENILVGRTGEVKLGDFGLAAKSSQENNELLGTAAWMCPEVIEREHYTHTIDTWSMGITCIEMMDRVPPNHELMDPELQEQLLKKILESTPSFRYSWPTPEWSEFVYNTLLEWDGDRRVEAAEAKRLLNDLIATHRVQCATSKEVADYVKSVFGLR